MKQIWLKLISTPKFGRFLNILLGKSKAYYMVRSFKDNPTPLENGIRDQKLQFLAWHFWHLTFYGFDGSSLVNKILFSFDSRFWAKFYKGSGPSYAFIWLFRTRIRRTRMELRRHGQERGINRVRPNLQEKFSGIFK